MPLYYVAHRTLSWYNRAVHSTWDLCIQERVVIDGVCKQYARKRKISEFRHQQLFLSISCSAFRMIWTSKSNQFGLHFTVESFEHVTLNKDYCRQEICVQVYTISKLIWEIKAMYLNVCNNGRRISPENWCVWVKQKYFDHKAFWFIGADDRFLMQIVMQLLLWSLILRNLVKSYGNRERSCFTRRMRDIPDSTISMPAI